MSSKMIIFLFGKLQHKHTNATTPESFTNYFSNKCSIVFFAKQEITNSYSINFNYEKLNIFWFIQTKQKLFEVGNLIRIAC